jgi:hypothetical protein
VSERRGPRRCVVTLGGGGERSAAAYAGIGGNELIVAAVLRGVWNASAVEQRLGGTDGMVCI